jgi:SLOG in TRPM, prokaryote
MPRPARPTELTRLVTSLLRVQLTDAASARAVQISEANELRAGLGMLGLQSPRPTVVIVGGAAGLKHLDRVRPAFVEAIVPVMEQYGAVGVDGGTQSGVMRVFGEARAAAQAKFPLVGVVAAGTVQLPHTQATRDTDAVLEPNHTDFVFVPGRKWGAEAPWIARTATVIAATAPSITVLINGGHIAYADVERSIETGRCVIVIAGSGRTADVFDRALAGASGDQRAATLARSGLIHSVPIGETSALAELLASILGESA